MLETDVAIGKGTQEGAAPTSALPRGGAPVGLVANGTSVDVAVLDVETGLELRSTVEQHG